MKRIIGIALSLMLMSGCGNQVMNTESEMLKPEIQQETSATESKEEKPSYQKITPEEAQKRMEGDVIVLDVRTKEEYDSGHIPNAVLLPDTQIAELAEELLPDKESEILLYCRSGRRSALAAQELADLGYTHVYDFGGILDWEGELTS